MKLPAILTRGLRRKPAPVRRPVQTTLKATAAARRGELDEFDTAEPTTSLSTAFIIVFLLHVVAVVGIYIFNHIKSTRHSVPVTTSASARSRETPKAPPAEKKSAAPAEARTEAATAPRREAPAAPKLAPLTDRMHHVQSGENLTRIATNYQVTVEALEQANNISSKDTLKVGTILTIPGVRTAPRPAAAAPAKTEPAKTVTAALPLKPTTAPAAKPAPAAAPKAEPRSYTVDKGDTLTYIAKRFKVSAESIQKLNNISDPKKLQPGRKLKIPAA